MLLEEAEVPRAEAGETDKGSSEEPGPEPLRGSRRTELGWLALSFTSATAPQDHNKTNCASPVLWKYGLRIVGGGGSTLKTKASCLLKCGRSACDNCRARSCRLEEGGGLWRLWCRNNTQCRKSTQPHAGRVSLFSLKQASRLLQIFLPLGCRSLVLALCGRVYCSLRPSTSRTFWKVGR